MSLADKHPADLVAELAPLAGLERFLDDPAVSEVMVNGGSQIWIDRAGSIQRVGTISESALLGALERILAPLGRRIDRLSPTVDARLADGSRLCAVIPPVAVDGPCVSIRRFHPGVVTLGAFAGPDVAAVVTGTIAARCNVLVSGATSTGKTTLLNALASLVPHNERIVTLEDTAELSLAHPHVVRLETRDATPDGVPEVTLDHLLRTALRMRPDRIVVGEVRGAEAVQLVQAMNTGHDGSLATIHANSATDAIRRLTSLVVAAVPSWPVAVVSELLASAIDVVIHLARDTAGRRRIVEVCELPAQPGQPMVRLVTDDHAVGTSTRARR